MGAAAENIAKSVYTGIQTIAKRGTDAAKRIISKLESFFTGNPTRSHLLKGDVSKLSEGELTSVLEQIKITGRAFDVDEYVRLKDLGLISKVDDLYKRLDFVDKAKVVRSNNGIAEYPTGNLGLAEGRVGTTEIDLKAYSRFNDGELGFVSRPNDGPFDPLEFGTIDRSVDTEFKILSQIAIDNSANKFVYGELYLFTERMPCLSCSKVINDFKVMYPNIILNIIVEHP